MLLGVVQARVVDMGCSFHGLYYPLPGEVLVGCLFRVVSFLASEFHVGCLLQVVFFLAAEVLREDLNEMFETLSFA